MGNAFINSLAITLPATFIPILIAAFAAYAFTFMEFWGRDFLFLAIVSLLVVPNYVAFVPMLQIYADLGMNGTFPAVWLAHIGFGMSLAIYILRNYMATLPKTVIESAKIDGASHFQTFFKLILPMSVPALASFAIFQFLWVWNDLLVALVFIGPGTNEPVTVALAGLAHERRPGLGAHHRRRLHRHHPADHRVPGHAAVLRPRHDGGRRQGLTRPPPQARRTPGQPRCPGVLLDPPSSPNSWGGLSHAVPARARRRPAHRRHPRRRRRGPARGLVARRDRPRRGRRRLRRGRQRPRPPAPGRARAGAVHPSAPARPPRRRRRVDDVVPPDRPGGRRHPARRPGRGPGRRPDAGLRAGGGRRRRSARPGHRDQRRRGRVRRRRPGGRAAPRGRPCRPARLHRPPRARAHPAAAHRRRRTLVARGSRRSSRAGRRHHGRGGDGRVLHHARERRRRARRLERQLGAAGRAHGRARRDHRRRRAPAAGRGGAADRVVVRLPLGVRRRVGRRPGRARGRLARVPAVARRPPRRTSRSC